MDRRDKAAVFLSVIAAIWAAILLLSPIAMVSAFIITGLVIYWTRRYVKGDIRFLRDK